MEEVVYESYAALSRAAKERGLKESLSKFRTSSKDGTPFYTFYSQPDKNHELFVFEFFSAPGQRRRRSELVTSCVAVAMPRYYDMFEIRVDGVTMGFRVQVSPKLDQDVWVYLKDNNTMTVSDYLKVQAVVKAARLELSQE